MDRSSLLKEPRKLTSHIENVLQQRLAEEPFFPEGVSGSTIASAVLFPLSRTCPDSSAFTDPCLVLNKRSQLVKQPGDLCFPGGAVSHGFDGKLGRLLRLPFFPLSRWPYWHQWRNQRPRQARRLSLLFATSVRESFEEMGLNPFNVEFLGPLPSQRLVMFRREIFPFVGWIRSQRRFFINREVEKIVHIPLRNLLNPDNYARYRLIFNVPDGTLSAGQARHFPCFPHRTAMGTEVLWGATFRIVMVFLNLIFGFDSPDLGDLRVVKGVIDKGYYGNGSVKA